MIWKPDTCLCEIEYSGNFEDYNLVKFINKCKLHTSSTFEEIHKNHHKVFNTVLESDKLKEQHKKEEKERISKL